jgi:hypothetical protein
MKTLLIVLASILVGGALGGFLALGFGSGVGAASGLIYGSQVGICAAAETARAQGIATDPAVLDRMIQSAVERIRSRTVSSPEHAAIEWVKDSTACQEMIQKLDQAPVIAPPAGAPQGAG